MQIALFRLCQANFSVWACSKSEKSRKASLPIGKSDRCAFSSPSPIHFEACVHAWCTSSVSPLSIWVATLELDSQGPRNALVWSHYHSLLILNWLSRCIAKCKFTGIKPHIPVHALFAPLCSVKNERDIFFSLREFLNIWRGGSPFKPPPKFREDDKSEFAHFPHIGQPPFGIRNSSKLANPSSSLFLAVYPPRNSQSANC